MGFAVLWQRLSGAHEPYLMYIAPGLMLLGLLNLWWLMTGRSLRVSELGAVLVLSVATVAHVVVVSLAPQPPGTYPNSGPYWAVTCVCVLSFLALSGRRAAYLSFTVLTVSVLLPWLLTTSDAAQSYAAQSPSGLLRVQLNAVVLVLLIWSLSWFRSQYTKQAHTEEGLRRLAYTDALTGLPNRHAVYPAVEALLSSAAQHQAGSLFLVDLDHFKRVNDGHGHAVGDEVLVAAAKIIQNCAAEPGQPAPTVGRWGGEEFIVVMPGTSAQRAQHRAAQLLKELEDAAWPCGLTITASIGSSSVTSGEGFSQLLARADSALYLAKQRGRNRAVIAELEAGEEQALGKAGPPN